MGTPLISAVETSALKLVIPAIGSIVILARFSTSPLLAGTARLPTMPKAALWISLYLGWMLATDFVFGWRGPSDFAPWRAAPVVASALRVLAIVFAGPLLEELVFRGLAFGALARSSAGPISAMFATAILWSLLHWSYQPLEIAIIMVAGVILGAARWRTGSLYLPIAMHMMWNAYAIW
jgi:membrane protease YdiL (CAAX protease family)